MRTIKTAALHTFLTIPAFIMLLYVLTNDAPTFTQIGIGYAVWSLPWAVLMSWAVWITPAEQPKKHHFEPVELD